MTSAECLIVLEPVILKRLVRINDLDPARESFIIPAVNLDDLSGLASILSTDVRN